MGPQTLQIVGFRHQQVAFVGSHDHGTVAQIDAVIVQLLADGIKILHRISAFAAGYVNYMDQNFGTLNMSQEIESQTCSLMCTLDDTCDISHYKTLVIDLNNSQVRFDCCEVIVCDFRFCFCSYR